jgi:hypothetical protein
MFALRRDATTVVVTAFGVQGLVQYSAGGEIANI